MVTIPPRDEAGEEGGEGSEEERAKEEVEGEEGGARAPLGIFCKGEAGGGPYPGRDMMGVVRFLAFGVLSFGFLLCFFFRRRFWGEGDRGAPP